MKLGKLTKKDSTVMFEVFGTKIYISKKEKDIRFPKFNIVRAELKQWINFYREQGYKGIIRTKLHKSRPIHGK